MRAPLAGDAGPRGYQGPTCDPAAERFLKVGKGASDNPNMGHTPLLQSRAPDGRTGRVEA